MLKYTSWISLSTIGIGCLLAALVPDLGSVLTSATAKLYGAEKFCVFSDVDPNATPCDGCLSDGNGGSVKCTSTFVSRTWVYAAGQSPAKRWDFSTVFCGGAAVYITGGTCSGTVRFYSSCGRGYTKDTLLGTANGVSCP